MYEERSRSRFSRTSRIRSPEIVHGADSVFQGTARFFSKDRPAKIPAMGNNAPDKSVVVPGYRYHSPNIPLAAIRRFARQLGERFRPDRIILFGSYAYGHPHAGSDVDLLVVMPAASEVNQSIRMTLAFEPPFPLDLIVRAPAKLKRRLAEGSSFLEQIVKRGKVIYEKGNRPLGPQSRSRPRTRKRTRPKGSAAQ